MDLNTGYELGYENLKTNIFLKNLKKKKKSLFWFVIYLLIINFKIIDYFT